MAFTPLHLTPGPVSRWLDGIVSPRRRGREAPLADPPIEALVTAPRPRSSPDRVAVNVTAGGIPELVRLEFTTFTEGQAVARIAAHFLGLEPRAYGLEKGGVPLDPRLSLHSNGVRDGDYLQLIDPVQRDFGRLDIRSRTIPARAAPGAARTAAPERREAVGGL